EEVDDGVAYALSSSSAPRRDSELLKSRLIAEIDGNLHAPTEFPRLRSSETFLDAVFWARAIWRTERASQGVATRHARAGRQVIYRNAVRRRTRRMTAMRM